MEEEKKQESPVSTATSLDELRNKFKKNEEGELLTLPSGITLKIKRPSLSRLIRDKRVPQNLVGAALRVVQNKNTANPNDLAENIALMEYILKLAIVEPAGMTDDDIASLSDDDKGMCFLYIQEGVADLESFRSQQLRRVS